MKDITERITVYSAFYRAMREGNITSAAREAAKSGARTVEFLDTVKRPAVADRETARRYRAVLKDHGLTVACFSAAARLWDPDRSDAEAASEEARLLRLAQMAAELGSPYLHHTVVMTWDTQTPYNEVLDRVTEPAVRVAEYARSLGVRVLYEPQGFYFNGNDGFRGLYRRVKAACPTVGVCTDIGNPMFVDEDPLLFVQEFARETCHVHVKDYRVCASAPDRSRGGRGLDPVLLGTGEVHAAECLSVLADAGYTGYFGVEDDGDAAFTATAELCAAWL